MEINYKTLKNELAGQTQIFKTFVEKIVDPFSFSSRKKTIKTHATITLQSDDSIVFDTGYTNSVYRPDGKIECWG